MKNITEFSLADGSTILVEVDEPVATGRVTRGILPGQATEKAKEAFEDALDKIRPAASAIVSRLRDMAEPPEQVSLEFGIKLSAAAGAFVASAASEANFKVTMSWKRTSKTT